MSDTPRTDALPVSDPMTEREAALFQHARTLERENAALRECVAELEAENSRLRKGLDDEGASEQERDTVNVPRQKP